MCMLDRVREKRGEIYSLAREHKADRLWVFGSCARKEERPDSDIDFLVRFPRGVTIDNYTQLNAELEKLLSRKVDLVSERCIHAGGPGARFSENVKRDMVSV